MIKKDFSFSFCHCQLTYFNTYEREIINLNCLGQKQTKPQFKLIMKQIKKNEEQNETNLSLKIKMELSL